MNTANTNGLGSPERGVSFGNPSTIHASSGMKTPRQKLSAISHLTTDTLGPTSSVLSFVRKLDQFEKDIETRYDKKKVVSNNVPIEPYRYGYRDTIIDLEIEREKRHYPCLNNGQSVPEYKARSRRYIPHGYGEDFQFKPHPTFQEPEYTDVGLDWKSRIRYIPSPHNPESSTEIWPEPWKGLRTYPDGTKINVKGMTSRTADEWALHPDANSAAKRCEFDGIHKATKLSSDEISHTMRFGRGKFVVDRRNAIPQAAPGDKSYQVVEYSKHFHKTGSTRPLVNFGGNGKLLPDTFVPLQELPPIPRESFHVREKVRQTEEQRSEVKELEKWRAASPLQPPGHSHPLPIAKNEPQLQIPVQE